MIRRAAAVIAVLCAVGTRADADDVICATAPFALPPYPASVVRALAPRQAGVPPGLRVVGAVGRCAAGQVTRVAVCGHLVGPAAASLSFAGEFALSVPHRVSGFVVGAAAAAPCRAVAGD